MRVASDVTDAGIGRKHGRCKSPPLGGVDLLVNAAGARRRHKLIGHPDELWHRVLALNLTGTYW